MPWWLDLIIAIAILIDLIPFVYVVYRYEATETDNKDNIIWTILAIFICPLIWAYFLIKGTIILVDLLTYETYKIEQYLEKQQGDK